ncbi:MAG: OFA family MFS transporter [Oscillospiraceae bacterium]|nr:OFA family MFS transporter [Oscillospiraceae bacterium]
MKKNNSKPLPAIIGALVVQLCVGILYLWSVFKTPIVTAFNWNASAAGMVSSYMIFAFVFGNLIGGFINDKKGPKLTCFLGVILFSLGVGLTAFLTEKTISLIYVTYAVMGGLGSGFAYGACISCIQKWLPHRRGLASGLACGAFGLSTVVFTPLSNALMNVFTTDGVVNFTPVFLILAGVFLVLGLVASSFVSLPSEEYIKSLNLPEKAVSGGENYTLGQSMKQPAFWCLFFSIFFINGTWNLCVPLIKDLGMTRGLAESAAIACVSFTGITNALGRIIMSTLSDKLGRANTMYILSGLTFVGAALMTFITGYGYFATIAIIAFAYGGPSALNAALCTDLFGAKHSGTNYGVAMLALGFSSIFFNWVSNNILKATVENVTSTFIMGAITALIPVVLMIIIQRTLNKRDAAKAES